MKKMTMWMLSGAAALVVTGAAFAVPALAQDNAPAGQAGPGFRMMHAMGDMTAMHSVMMPLMNQMPAMHEQVMGDVAGQFGMTLDELSQALKEKSLAAIAEEKGIATGEVRATMTNSMKTFLDKLVADDVITQEQVGQMLGFMEKNQDACLTGQMEGMMGTGMMTGGMMRGAAGARGCH